jgi:hypothetical protein
MVAYNDSEKATLCSKITNQNCLSLIRKLTSMNMDDYIHRFWLHGVHYYKTSTEIKQSWSASCRDFGKNRQSQSGLCRMSQRFFFTANLIHSTYRKN